MRHGRAKAARKTLQYFKRLTGSTPPYKILLDATIVATLFTQHVLPIQERVDKVLQTFVVGSYNHNTRNTYCITKSAVEELEMIYQSLNQNHKGSSKAEAFEQAIQWIKKECKILEVCNEKEEDEEYKEDDDSDSSDSSDVDDDDNHDNKKRQKRKTKKRGRRRQQQELTKAQKDMIFLCTNPNAEQHDPRPFVIGSQDELVLDLIRRKGMNPVVRLANQSVLLLENPSKSSQIQTTRQEKQKWKSSCLASSEKQLVDYMFQKEKKGGGSGTGTAAGPASSSTQQSQQQRTKGKAKGPNPLSCKKKRSHENKSSKEPKESSSSKRRKRAKAAAEAKKNPTTSDH